VLVAKFADHLPLYRQAVIYAREGVDLDRALLASWVGAASALLRPLVDAVRCHVLVASRLHRTTPRSRCWRPATAKPRRRAYGPTCAMTGQPARPRHKRFGSPTSPTAGASIRKHTWRSRGRTASRCLRRLQCLVRRRHDQGSGMLGACPTRTPRPARGATDTADHRGQYAGSPSSM
jgi:hypothetical protein